MDDVLSSCLNAEGMSAQCVYDKINQELETDGDRYKDLGSFTAVQMNPQARQLVMDNMGINLINQNEFPQTTKIHQILVTTLATLLHAPDQQQVTGCSTSGSSEACAIAMVAHKGRWKERAALTDRPNIVLGSNAHLCWRKFATYFDIEVREVVFKDFNQYPLEDMLSLVDQNTICVVAVMGSTYTGFCEPIKAINDGLTELNQRHGWNVGIHVDAATGGFIRPFIDDSSLPDWDFTLPLVQSINLSGHKYGLVYPGIGWLILRDETILPDKMNMTASYLTGETQSFAITFSRSSALVIAQYFNFLFYGIAGYKAVIANCLKHAKQLTSVLNKLDGIKVISEQTLPIVAFLLEDDTGELSETFTAQLKQKGWLIPCYMMPSNIKQKVMRIVIREDMTNARLDELIQDICEVHAR
ncbi:glutamate decarboxylase [Celerinatantimonas sp. MCCC 1A17872]|uniref:glutamate decarboxylase n=1 Tax=Celerinatantimonas sp. MCCC 1A17872 TaxID=3177514 RepID=UPI0038C1BCC0